MPLGCLTTASIRIIIEIKKGNRMHLTLEEHNLLPLLAKVILIAKAGALQKAPSFDNLVGCRKEKAPKITSLGHVRYRRCVPRMPVFEEVLSGEVKAVDVRKIGLEALLEALYESLSQLTPREVDILRKRYFLSDAEAWTFESLGAKYGISRQRVQQVEDNALKKLRTALNAKFMNDYAM
jgi:hypothetical protein